MSEIAIRRTVEGGAKTPHGPDHMADPDHAIREMARVLTPDGRLLIGAGNFTGLGPRMSRVVYALGRALRLLDRDRRRFWDSPVGIEHTFACTAALLERLCNPYLEIEHRFGVSMGWGAPGWTPLLARLPEPAADKLVRWVDRRATGWPAVADFVYLVCRPRPRASWPVRRSPSVGGFAVPPDDVVYPHKATSERLYWAKAQFGGTIIRSGPVGTRLVNTAHTGDPERGWLDDLLARGPFRDAAMLGCDEERYDAEWLRRGGSPRLDVYEFSPVVIRRVRRHLGRLRRRTRFVRVDLNFAQLPAERYDVIWSSGCLHHIVNLEHLYLQIERALRTGGLFVVHDYVGARRMQYDPARLDHLNALYREVPPQFRRAGVTEIASRPEQDLSPSCAVRSDEVLALAEARFEVVHKGVFGALLPLLFALDLDAIATEAPGLLAQLMSEEKAAQHQSASAYVVFRRRPRN